MDSTKTDNTIDTTSITGPSYSLGSSIWNSLPNAWTTTNSNAVDWSTLTVGGVTPSATLELQGNNADVVVNGESLMQTLQVLKDRLNWLQPNPDMEAEWDELRELGERYRELERQCQEKSQVWNTLKKMPAPIPK
jgi:hypothetical protein